MAPRTGRLNSEPKSDRRHASAPTWFRYGIVALATLILCSCTSVAPRSDNVQVDVGDRSGSRIASAKGAEHSALTQETWRGQSPHGSNSPIGAQTPPSPPRLQHALAELPTHLTPAQMAQASAPLKNCRVSPCGCGSCAALGPKDEYLCDGGDYGAEAGVRRDGVIVGLEQEDAIAHYDTLDDRTIVTPSNKVCIYAPRFGVVRKIIDLHATLQAAMPIGAVQETRLLRFDEQEAIATRLNQSEPTIDRQQTPPSLLLRRAQAGELDADRAVADAVGSLAAVPNLMVVQSGTITGEEIVAIGRCSLAAIAWAGDQATQVYFDARQAMAEVSIRTPGTIYVADEPSHPKLRLIKLADRCAAQLGDEVQFTLRFDNVGDQEIGNVALVDNLTTRLEYVDGSQEASVDAEFKSKVNQGQTLVLRWEIKEPIKPGAGGVIVFRCKVR